MGGLNSRLHGAEGEGGVSDKIRPILVRRFQELRKNKDEEGTLSKKQLLKDAQEADTTCHEQENQLSKEEVDNNHKNHEQEKEIHVDEKPENEQQADVKNGDDDDESEEVGGFLYPGSPSFKIYYIEAEERKEEECKKQTIARHKKSHSAACVESGSTENSGNLDEVPQAVEIESTPKRKENKIKKFGAMKTLHKVKSFYQPMCTCTGNDRSRLIGAKAAN